MLTIETARYVYEVEGLSAASPQAVLRREDRRWHCAVITTDEGASVCFTRVFDTPGAALEAADEQIRRHFGGRTFVRRELVVRND